MPKADIVRILADTSEFGTLKSGPLHRTSLLFRAVALPRFNLVLSLFYFQFVFLLSSSYFFVALAGQRLLRQPFGSCSVEIGVIVYRGLAICHFHVWRRGKRYTLPSSSPSPDPLRQLSRSVNNRPIGHVLFLSAGFGFPLARSYMRICVRASPAISTKEARSFQFQ